ncbi:MAG: type III restriction-modification system subunit M [Candidatus Desulfovibrio kirbyi]|uniref:site-specific DNA-methyltransferase (adenine-specific) n=1 Tax=Candidatus Desulfovibrio kirbyi TaxID=2696086 RepID=A0A6L2R548_9BACT|nr:MAG: type III restriction-modification system subunit M [Candidatus Desulfovibrio kirbyi]
MPRLTPQEQQEIFRFIEADKPLPEKYRFLLFEDKREVELVWNGKTSEVCNVVLPFQTIENVDEPRVEKQPKQQMGSLFDIDPRGRQLKGWTNKLIWGDNKLILSSLKSGPMREEIEAQGGLKLIYIDPPFDVGADFSMNIEIGEETFIKRPNILEEIAYRDTWGKGADSFISMIYERLVLMRDLLAEDGSIYVHCDWRVNSWMKMVLSEIFCFNNLISEIIWKHQIMGGAHGKSLPKAHETLLWFKKNDTFRINVDAPQIRVPFSEYVLSTIQKDSNERYFYTRRRMSRKASTEEIETKAHTITYIDDPEKGTLASDVWDDFPSYQPKPKDNTKYPTQKSNEILERVIGSASSEGDLVADFFCGSGTTAAVAEKLGRKWIATDLGKFAIHTTRKRLIGVQRQLKKEGKHYRAFEILNLGKYERQHYIGVNPDLREEQKQQQLAAKEAAFLDLILRAYRAEKVEGFTTFHGKKAGRLVVVGPVNMPVTRLVVEEIILECRKKHFTKVDILGFEFEMGIFPNVLDEARAKGIDIAPKYIPAEVFDKRAVEKNQVVFHDVAFIEVKPHYKKNSVAVELTDFSVFYSQDSVAAVEAALKNKSSKIVVELGQIIKVVKDNNGIVTREALTQKWTDWIDYWSVDFDFESKREIIREKNSDTGEIEEKWTGTFVFENEWQSFRTKKDRNLELTSVFHTYLDGVRKKIAVKVVDIFGNDTMTIIEVTP